MAAEASIVGSMVDMLGRLSDDTVRIDCDSRGCLVSVTIEGRNRSFRGQRLEDVLRKACRELGLL